MRSHISISTVLAVMLISLVNYGVCSYNLGTYLRKGSFRGLEKLRKRQDQGPMHRKAPCFELPQLEALKAQFSTFIDQNNDGKASESEVRDYLRKYNPDVTEGQVREFMLRRDSDGNGEVDFIPDYLMEVSSPSYSLSAAKEWFNLEDSNHDGYVSRDELIRIAENIGMSREEAERTADGYYMVADDGDKKLDWNEYATLFI